MTTIKHEIKEDAITVAHTVTGLHQLIDTAVQAIRDKALKDEVEIIDDILVTSDYSGLKLIAHVRKPEPVVVYPPRDSAEEIPF